MSIKKFFALITLLFFWIAQGFAEMPTEDKEKIKSYEGKQVILRRALNDCRTVYVYIGGEKFYYRYGKGNLFSLKNDVPVTVSEIKIYDQTYTYDFKKRYDPKHMIKITVEKKGFKDQEIIFHWEETQTMNLKKFKIMWVRAFVQEGESFFPYYGDITTNVVHINGANHLPPEQIRKGFLTIESAESEGFKICPICFSKISNLEGYGLEKALGKEVAAKVRYYYPLDSDQGKRKLVENIGSKILSNWPTALKGYNYRFYVIDSEGLNAISCPTGSVFITNSLLSSLETDMELEAVLAHEITHVEKRHGFRQYKTAESAAVLSSILTGIAGVVAAKKTESPQITYDVVKIMDSLGKVAADIVLSGYSRKYETEADAYATAYMNKMYGNRGKNALINVLSKLKYHADIMEVSPSGKSLFDTHPQIDEKLRFLKDMIVTCFSRDNLYGCEDNSGNLIAQLSIDAVICYPRIVKDSDGKPYCAGYQNWILGSVEATGNLVLTKVFRDKPIKIHFAEILIGKKKIRLNVFEKAFLYPNSVTDIKLECKSTEILMRNKEISNISLYFLEKGKTSFSSPLHELAFHLRPTK